MHVVEHLQDIAHLMSEVGRVLKPGGVAYFETPHPKTVLLPSARGRPGSPFTMNFYDDPTHVRPVPVTELATYAHAVQLDIVASGISRNWLFAAAYPFLLLSPPSRKKFTARVHWLGWSAFLIAKRPA